MAEMAKELDVGQQAAQLSDAVHKKRAESAREWFKWWMDTGRREFTSAARTLGLGENGRTLCAKFYRRTLDGDPARIILAVEALRAQLEGPEGITEFVGFRETRCVKSVLKYAAAARDGHAIGLLIGSMGFGKTEAIREFQRRTEGDGKPPVEYLYCRISTNLPSLINDIAAQIGLIGPDSGGDPARLHKQIAHRLKSRPIFLVFDEADYLNRRCLDFIRNLNDESGAGSLLVGRPGLLKTIQEGISWTTLTDQEKERLVRDGPLAPFADRVFFVVLPGLSDDEVVEIAEDTLKAQLTDEAISKLLFYVGPNFRLLSRMIGKLRDIRVRAAKKIDQQMIEAAWLRLQYLNLEVQKR
ncbi:MAG: ATP-binding protein [Deltaproteobacteria bacterium]|nr:ATP-binding protein [Deltaproteobacteria bacterium]